MENNLLDVKINVKIILAALWIAVNMLYIYVDLYGFYVAGEIDKIRDGKLGSSGMQVSQGGLLIIMILMAIPSLMVFLSVVLDAKVNRLVNIIIGIFQIVVVVGSSFIGVPEPFYAFGSTLEVILLILIIWYAWKWPTQ